METSGPRNAGSSVPRTNRTCSTGKCSRAWHQNLLKINLHFLGVNHNIPNFCGSLQLWVKSSGGLLGFFRDLLSDIYVDTFFINPVYSSELVKQLQGGGDWVMFPSFCFLLGGFWCPWNPQRWLAMCDNFSWGFYQSGSAWGRGKEAAIICALSVKLKNIPVFCESVTEKEKGKEMAKLHHDFSTSDRHEVLLWSDCDLDGGIHIERTEFIGN